MTEPTISACMIVGNEEKHIKRCLNSLWKAVDEIVINYNGDGSDKTLSIIKEFPNARVEKTEWRDDYAAARNVALSMVKTDWALSIDADEEVSKDHERMREVLAQAADEPCLAVLFLDMGNGINYQAGKVWNFGALKRLFNMKFQPHYINRYHEECVFGPDHKRVVNVSATNLYIKHWGYDLPKEQIMAKCERAIRILREMLKENPRDYKVWFHLAQAYHVLDGYEEQVEMCAHYFFDLVGDKMPRGGGPFMAIYHYAFMALWKRHDYERALATVREGLGLWENDINLLFDLGMVGHKMKRPELVYEAAERYKILVDNYRINPVGEKGEMVLTANDYCQKRMEQWVRDAA